MNSNIKDLKINPMALIKLDESARAPPIPCQHVTISGRHRAGSHGICHSPDPARSSLRLPFHGSPGTRRLFVGSAPQPIVTILVCFFTHRYDFEKHSILHKILHDALCRFLSVDLWLDCCLQSFTKILVRVMISRLGVRARGKHFNSKPSTLQ